MRYCKHCLQPIPDTFPALRADEWEKTLARKSAQDAAQARRVPKPKFTGKKKKSYPETPSLNDL
jgi:hypothetical protein